MTELPRVDNAGKPAGDELDIDSISARVGISSAWMKEHIEEFAAAYLKHTNLPPDQAIMFIKTCFEGLTIKQVIWFESKAEESERDALLARLRAAEACINEDHARYSFDYCPTCNRMYASMNGHGDGCAYAAWQKERGEE